MFKKILIANRGEIGVRIIRACRDLGISPVTVYSDADRDAQHVTLSDEAYHIGASPSAESYLAIERILDAAGKAGVEAIHPGYGFLSENDAFAQACEDSGFKFIGPSVASMKLMGDKLASRSAVHAAGVPVIPGREDPLSSLQDGLQVAARIGYPVMLKASSGGGGKGLRLVPSEDEFSSAYQTARNEARSAFGDATMYLEKYVARSRHVEIQVLGDLEGNLIHLGERECSIQRRHQKLLEESPSLLVDEELRQQLGEAALTVARTAQYYSAGTVEFILGIDSSGGNPNFYFLEMNTRLQVEHPVTELVTGVDLVHQQILVAAGQKMTLRQEDMRLKGAAMECRIYAEDPYNNFLPSPGKITTYSEPAGPGIRTDSGVNSGSIVPVEYDPLLSKLLAHGEDRPQAIARMRRALGEYKVGGLHTTIPFFETLLSHSQFLEGRLHTEFIEEQQLVEQMHRKLDGDELAPLIAAAVHYFCRTQKQSVQSGDRRSSWGDRRYFPNQIHSR